MPSIQSLVDAAASALRLYDRLLGLRESSADEFAAAVLHRSLREYVSPGPYGPWADGLSHDQLKAIDGWPSDGAMDCAVNDVLKEAKAAGDRHGRGANLGPAAIRRYADLLIERQQLIDSQTIAALYQAAVTESSAWHSSAPLVIKRIDTVVRNLNRLESLPPTLDRRDWERIKKIFSRDLKRLAGFVEPSSNRSPAADVPAKTGSGGSASRPKSKASKAQITTYQGWLDFRARCEKLREQPRYEDFVAELNASGKRVTLEYVQSLIKSAGKRKTRGSL